MLIQSLARKTVLWFLAWLGLLHAQTPAPLDPLDGAILAAHNFAPAERLQFYVELIDKFKTSRSSRLREWIDLALDTAQSLPLSWNRSAAEKNVITSLASIDPKLALHRLTLLSPTPADDRGRRSEDLRTFAAKTIFAAAFQSGIPIPKLLEAAISLSSEGDFPFDALGRVLAAAADGHDPDEFRSAVFQAASHYQRATYADNVDSEYASFLRQVWPKLTLAERTVVLEPFLKQLELVAANSEDTTLSKVVLIGEQPRLTKAVASRLMGGLDFAREQFAQAQFERWAKLKLTLSVDELGGEPLGAVAVNAKDKPDNVALAKVTAKVQERGDLRWILQNRNTEPGLLFQRLSRLSSLDLRYQAISAILANLSPDSAEAKDLRQQMKQIEQSKLVPEVRLKILLTKIRADAQCESPQFKDLARTALDLGHELFSLSYDTAIFRPAYDHRGYDETMEIVERDSKCNPQRGLASANQLTHPVLRPYAVISAVAAGSNHR